MKTWSKSLGVVVIVASMKLVRDTDCSEAKNKLEMLNGNGEKLGEPKQKEGEKRER
jgi:hypothetical protein